MSDVEDAGEEAGEDAPATSEPTSAALTRRADPFTNTLVSWVLRSGLLLSLVVLLAGLVAELATGTHHAIRVKMFDLFAPRPVGERTLAVGVLLLTLTPACGVLSVLVGFVRERDRRFALSGALVVIVLCAAVAVGFG